MSLREEIYNLTLAYGEYVNDWEREQMTDKILNLFGKRIDELRKEKILNLEPTEEYAGILKGLRMAKEMLK